METSSAHSPHTRLSFGPSRALAKATCGETPGIDRPASKWLNLDSTPVLRNFIGDWIVVRKAIAGNAAAQEQLFGCNRPKLYRIALVREVISKLREEKPNGRRIRRAAQYHPDYR